MRRINALLIVILLALVPSVALALGLDEAKAKGLVGERPDGYIGAVVPAPSGEVTSLVSEINAKRKAEYQRIAKKNGTDLAVVERISGKKAIEKTKAGQFIMSPSGAWQRK